MDYKPTIAPWQ